jgi:hypothetical protein
MGKIRMLGRTLRYFMLLLLAVSGSLQAAIPDNERTALLNLYASTAGLTWTINENWLGAPGTECTWSGIICDAQQAHVIGIDLHQNNLIGTLPPLTSMIMLQNFDASDNRLTGVIPPLATLTQLQTFYLDDNQLSGPLPALNGLTVLINFGVANNQLSGSLPSLAGLNQLWSFDVSGNQLTGTLPALDQVPRLHQLAVGGNRLSGGLDAMLKAPQLYYASFDHNHISGPIPPLAGMTNLIAFSAGNNQLTGTIPALTNLRGLEFFAVNDNQLRGNVPALTGLSRLQTLRVSNNQLSGAMPSLDDQVALIEIDLDGNQLNGDLPDLGHTNLQAGRSALCPNAFNPTASAFADFATRLTPWFGLCTAFVNLNQHGLTGSWYNPTESGQGFVLEAYPDITSGEGILAGGWFTFSSGLPIWYAIQGAVSSKTPYAEMGIYKTSYGRMDAPPILSSKPVGLGKIMFSDCNSALFHYQVSPNGFETQEGVIALSRIDVNMTCSAQGDNGNQPSTYLMSGAWYDPATSGQGFIFDVNPLQHNFAATWYTFPDQPVSPLIDPGQRWFTLQAQMASGATSLSNVGIYAVAGGIFDAPDPVSVTRVGNADINLASCTSVTVKYTFDTGEFSGKTGTINLQRTGPTPANCNL